MSEEWPRSNRPDLNNRPGERDRIPRSNRAAVWIISAVILILLFVMWWWLWGNEEETNTNINTNTSIMDEITETNTNTDIAEETVNETVDEAGFTNAPIPELIFEETVPPGP
ncbi:MAG: hypothetical protein ABIB97_02240 [Patescibacteria group bacterium]